MMPAGSIRPTARPAWFAATAERGALPRRNARFALFRATALLAFGVAASLPIAAGAQQIDFSHGGPIDISADDGLEWQQATQEIIARGNAHATRGNVTVTADRLIAHYRKKAATPGQAAPAGAAAPPSTAPAPAAPTTAAPASGHQAAGIGFGDTGGPDASGSEIYRVEAVGVVHIDTPTDHITGDHATYDIDQAVLLITGDNLRLTTPSETLTARDDLEYWSQKHMAVARGNAVLLTHDGRRIAADVLVAYTDEGQGNHEQGNHEQGNHEQGNHEQGNHETPHEAAKPVQTVSAAAHPATPQPDDPLAASGKLKKAEAWGHVSIRTVTDTVTGDRGVYVPETGIARIAGNVHITRGQNQINGPEAEVNLKTGISRILSGPSERVQGLVVPSDANAQANGPQTKPTKPTKPNAEKP